MLDISSNDKGMLIPRVSLTGTSDISTISSPATSLLVYNTRTVSNVTPGFYYWNGTAWTRLAAGNNVVTASNGLYTSSNDVRLGGTLTNGTMISFDNNELTFQLDGSGDFIIEDSDDYLFEVRNTGQINVTRDANLQVQGPFRYNNTAAAPGLNKVLRSDASGNATWVDPNTLITPEDDHDWYEQGGTNAPNSINDNIYTQGNVGIGTTAPSTTLHVASAGDPMMLERSSGQVNSARFLFSNSPFGVNVLATGSLVLATNHSTTQADMGFSANGNSANTGDVQLVIKNSGNVGIGTTSPSTRLEAIGTSGATETYSYNQYTSGQYSSRSGSFAPIARFKNGTSATATGLEVLAQTNGNGIMLTNSNNYDPIHIGSSYSATNGTSVLTISNGRVGVGCLPQSDYKLDVYGGNAKIGWHGNSNEINILPSDFVQGTSGSSNQFYFDGSGLRIASNGYIYAFVAIPQGYNFKSCRIYSSSTRSVVVGRRQINGSGNYSTLSGTTAASINVGPSSFGDRNGDSNYFYVRIDVRSGDRIYGGEIKIQPE